MLAHCQAQLLRCGFEELIEEKNTGEIPDTSLAVKLMMNQTKDDKNLPGVLAPEWEYKLSSVFVEANTPSVTLEVSATSCFYCSLGLRIV